MIGPQTPCPHQGAQLAAVGSAAPPERYAAVGSAADRNGTRLGGTSDPAAQGVDSGIILLKCWLEVSPEEQTRRLTGRIDDPRKVWKLTDMDVKSYAKWNDYTAARDAMFAATSTSWAPWFVAVTDDKKRGRLNVITHLLGRIPYEPMAPREVKLPRRRVTAAAPPADSFHAVPEAF